MYIDCSTFNGASSSNRMLRERVKFVVTACLSSFRRSFFIVAPRIVSVWVNRTKMRQGVVGQKKRLYAKKVFVVENGPFGSFARQTNTINRIRHICWLKSARKLWWNVFYGKNISTRLCNYNFLLLLYPIDVRVYKCNITYDMLPLLNHN